MAGQSRTAGRSGMLLHGQRYVWLRHQHLPAEVRADSNVLRRVPLPPGIALGTVRSTLNYLVRRHEGLRTTVHFDVDEDPHQVVHPPAPLSVATVSTERDGTPSPAEVIAELTGVAFELGKEWPIRACVVTTGGQPTQLVLVLNHMTVDAWSVEVFEQELEALGAGVAAGRPTVLRPVRHQPLDLVRYENSAPGRVARDEAAAYWRGQLAQVPDDVAGPGPSGVAAGPAFGATLTSPDLLEGARRVAKRHRVWPSVVHLAAYATAVAALTGRPGCVPYFLSGNRDSTAYPDVLTCLFSPVLLHLDGTDDPTFGVLLQRVADRLARAAAHPGLPYDELLELVATESASRGRPLRLGAEVNFLNHGAHVSRARRSTLVRHPFAAYSASGATGPDTVCGVYEQSDAVAVRLTVRSPGWGTEDVERFLRGYEAVILAHRDPAIDLRRSEAVALIGGTPVAATAGTDPVAPGPVGARAPGAAQALERVVAEVNGLAQLSPAQGYVAAGGRVLRIPRVQVRLAEHGWAGLGIDDLIEGRPLSELAARLRWIGCAGSGEAGSVDAGPALSGR